MASLATSQEEELKAAMEASIEESLEVVQESSQLEVRGTCGAMSGFGCVARAVRYAVRARGGAMCGASCARCA